MPNDDCSPFRRLSAEFEVALSSRHEVTQVTEVRRVALNTNNPFQPTVGPCVTTASLLNQALQPLRNQARSSEHRPSFPTLQDVCGE